MTTIAQTRSLSRLRPFYLNPRDEDDYRDMDELKDSLTKLGQLQPLHVWETPEADWVLIGHRRLRAMVEMGWLECLQIVHHCADEGEALEIVLSDHGHTVPLNASEKITAATNALKTGLGVERAAAALGVNEDRVQLWFQLGDVLPAKAREAMAADKLSMNTAEVLLKVDKSQIAAAVQMILYDFETQQPMSHGQAVAAIESQFIRPAQWRRAWQELEIKLKKKLPVIEGYQYVAFDDRRTYTLGESGQPEPGYEFAEDVVPKDADGRTFGDRAKALGVPIYVVPAPRHEDKHVLLVSARMLRDAESVGGGGGVDGGELMVDGGDGEEGQTGVSVSRVVVESEGDEVGMTEAQKVKWLMRAIDDKLRERPAVVMTAELWDYLVPVAASLGAGTKTALDWIGEDGTGEMIARVQADTCARAALRWVFLLLLCYEDDHTSEPLSVMSDIARHLGVDVEKLVNA